MAHFKYAATRCQYTQQEFLQKEKSVWMGSFYVTHFIFCASNGKIDVSED